MSVTTHLTNTVHSSSNTPSIKNIPLIDQKIKTLKHRLLQLNGRYYKDPASLLHRAYNRFQVDSTQRQAFDMLKEERTGLLLTLKSIHQTLKLRRRLLHIEVELQVLCGVAYRDRNSLLDRTWRAYKAGQAPVDTYQQLEVHRQDLQKEKKFLIKKLVTLDSLKTNFKPVQCIFNNSHSGYHNPSDLIKKKKPPELAFPSKKIPANTEKILSKDTGSSSFGQVQRQDQAICAVVLRMGFAEAQEPLSTTESCYPLSTIETTMETCVCFEKHLYRHCHFPKAKKELIALQSKGENIAIYLQKALESTSYDPDSVAIRNTWLCIQRRHSCSMGVLNLLIKSTPVYASGFLIPDTIHHLHSILPAHVLFTAPWVEVITVLRKDPYFVLDVQLLKQKMREKPSLNISQLSQVYKQNQQEYNTSMHVYIRLGALYKAKYQLNFYQLVCFFSYARCLLNAFYTLEFKFSDYGMPRYDRVTTPVTKLSGVYESILVELRSKYPEIHFQKSYQVKAWTGQKEIPLSMIDGYRNLLYHTDAKWIPDILAHLEQLYTQACASKDPSELIALSGKIFWWFCHAKPLKLGDPSTIEMLLRALWEEKGIPSPTWRKDVIPWKEVIKELDVEQFAKNFYTLFTWPK
ncbi:MAG: hypothetical protein KGZ39_03635 [Simkania sp.]|nr:hypothetical protein [Simkania sp.]